jgi:hypothetical protein
MENLMMMVAQLKDITAALVESGGEITPEMEAGLLALDAKIPAKIDSYAAVLERLDLEEGYWKQKADAFDRIAKGCRQARERMKDRLKLAMHEMGTDELKGVDARFKMVRSRPSLAIDESSLPDDFKMIETKVKPDREKIEETIKTGASVPGVTVVPSFGVRQYINKADK